ARFVQSFKQFLLTGWQAHIGTITAREAGVAHTHLFAFNVTGQATYKYHYICRFGIFKRFIERRLRAGHAPGETNFGIAYILKVFELYVIRFAGLKFDSGALAVQTLGFIPAIEHFFTVDK